MAWIALACVPSLAWAGLPFLEPRTLNVERQRTEVLGFLQALASQPESRSLESGILVRKLPKWDRRRFQGLIHGAYSVNRVLGGVGMLAALGPVSVGSPFQGSQAALLADYAALLTGSANPSLAQASALLGEESQAVSQGDSAQAQALAQAFAALAPQSVPADYQPDADDAALDAGMRAVTSYDWAALLEALGQAVLAGVAGAMTTGVYGALVAVALSLTESALQGQFSQQNVSYTGSGGASSGSNLSGGQGDGGAQGSTLSQALAAVGGGQNAGSASLLNVPGGAAGQKVQVGQGTAQGGVLVGAQSVP